MSDISSHDEAKATVPRINQNTGREETSDIIEANRRIRALISDLKTTSARLKVASTALVTADKNLFKRTGQLKSAEGALVASDQSLLEDNEHLERLVQELAIANEKLLRASESIANNEKMQTEFINIAAHELRTPIQPILGVLELYDTNSQVTQSEDKQRERTIVVEKAHLELIRRNANRLERLSSDILDATRIESKNLKLKIDKNVDLIRLISYAIKDTTSNVATGNIKFLANFPEEGVEANVDSYRILQVLANLLDNAIKFTPKGTVSMTIRKINNDGIHRAEVIISDEGKGIDPEIMPGLFQKFSSKTDSGTGTGLGLYISKAIIEAHEGKIWAAMPAAAICQAKISIINGKSKSGKSASG